MKRLDVSSYGEHIRDIRHILGDSHLMWRPNLGGYFVGRDFALLEDIILKKIHHPVEEVIVSPISTPVYERLRDELGAPSFIQEPVQREVLENPEHLA